MHQVLVNQMAPDFTSAAVDAKGNIVEQFNLRDYFKGSHGIVFFYPLDFTFVCPSELISLSNRMSEFESRNTKVVSVSIDSQFTHLAWRNTPVDQGGIGPVGYPMVADIDHSIAQSYGVEHASAKVALRGAFVIDQQGIVQAQVVNNLPLGRNIDELIRLIDALQFHEVHGEVCPANWQKGGQGMTPDTEGVARYLSAHAEEL